MKIGLLTVPFNNNYGGLLQAFALKKILEELGHEVWIINRKRNRPSILRLYLSKFKKFILQDPSLIWNETKKIKTISQYTSIFIEKYLTPQTEVYYSNSALKKCPKFDFYIVGSDQVWRYKFAPKNISNYFFDFLQNSHAPRISYAASFGTSNKEYDSKTIQKCQALLLKFKAISVREKSGIHILNKEFGVDKEKVKFVLDPTFLLPLSTYKQLIIPKKDSPSNYLFSYILDKDQEKNKLIDYIKQEKKLDVISMTAQTHNLNAHDIIPPVESWLSNIYHAAFVVTDSFHGMVFSIIFNKPFIVYTNKQRGVDRFTSLLELIGLEYRMIDSYNNSILQIISTPIEWTRINSIIEHEKENSLTFLRNNLQ